MNEATILSLAVIVCVTIGSCTQAKHELHQANEGLHKAAVTIRAQEQEIRELRLEADVLRRRAMDAYAGDRP